MFDKRKFPRLGEIWELDYRKIGLGEFKKDPLSTFTVNISGGGIHFEVDEEIPKGTMLALELRSTTLPSTIIGIGKTAWCKMGKQEDKYNVGIEFWWTGWRDNDAQKALADYINKKIPEHS
jgi:hypothetical protein